MAKRPLTPPAPEPQPAEQVVTIGLDIGYGATKAIAPGFAPIIFPSVWGLSNFPSKKDRAQIIQSNPVNATEILLDGGQEWLIGDLAQRQIGSGQLNYLRGRSGSGDSYGNDARLRFFKATIGKLGKELGLTSGEVLHVRLATGLPVAHMDGADALEEVLKGLHQIKTDAVDFTANIADLFVMPQPYGTIYAKQFTETGEYDPCYTATKTAVVDVGTYTVDLALDQDGEYIIDESDSVNGGVYQVHQRLINNLKRDGYDMERTKPGELDSILKNRCIKVGSKTERVDAAVEDALEGLIGTTVNRMKQLWGTARTIDTIFLSGGGATLIKDAVLEAGYKEAVLVENSQFANAQGYCNFALFDARS